jgi:hypothetical protein
MLVRHAASKANLARTVPLLLVVSLGLCGCGCTATHKPNAAASRVVRCVDVGPNDSPGTKPNALRLYLWAWQS